MTMGDGEMVTELGRDEIKWDGDRQTEKAWGSARTRGDKQKWAMEHFTYAPDEWRASMD